MYVGLRCYSIIEQLVECNFECGDDFNNLQLQSTIHKEMVCPSEALELELRGLYHDPRRFFIPQKIRDIDFIAPSACPNVECRTSNFEETVH